MIVVLSIVKYILITIQTSCASFNEGTKLGGPGIGLHTLW